MSGERDKEDMVLQESSAAYLTDQEDIGLWLLKDSLAKTPWERMQAKTTPPILASRCAPR